MLELSLLEVDSHPRGLLDWDPQAASADSSQVSVNSAAADMHLQPTVAIQLLEQHYRSATATTPARHPDTLGPHITKAIKQCGIWQEVQAVVQSYRPKLNAINVSAAIVHVAQLLKAQAAASSSPQHQTATALPQEEAAACSACVRQLLVMVNAHLGQLEARQLANICWACATLGLKPEPQWLERISQQMIYLKPQHFSIMLWSLAASCQHPGNEWMQQLLSASMTALPACQPEHLATLMWSLATLGVEPTPTWLTAWTKAVTVGQQVWRPQDIQMTLWALVNMGSVADATAKQLVPLLCERVQHAGEFDIQAISSTLWAFAKLAHRPSPRELAVVLNMVRTKAHLFNGQAVSNTLWALAALCVLPGRDCIDSLLSAVERNLPTMTPQALCNVLWALGVLECKPSDSWFNKFCSTLHPVVDGLTAQGLCNILWAVARLELQPPEELTADLCSHLEPHVADMTTQGLSNSMWALAKLGLHDNSPLASAVIQQVGSLLDRQQLHQQASASSAGTSDPQDTSSSSGSPTGSAAVAAFQAEELAMMLQACSSMHSQQLSHAEVAQTHGLTRQWPGQHDDSWRSLVPLLVTASEQQLPACDPQELATLLHALCVLKYRPSKQWLSRWLHCAQATFQQAYPIDLSQYAWCLARLNAAPAADWFAGFQVESYRKMPRFNAQVGNGEGLSVDMVLSCVCFALTFCHVSAALLQSKVSLVGTNWLLNLPTVAKA